MTTKRRKVYQFAALWTILLVVSGCAVVDHAVGGLLDGPAEVVPLSGSWLRRLTVTVQDPIGGAIQSTGGATSDAAISGIIRGVYIDYTTLAVTTTDITLVGSAPGKADMPILTVTDVGTDTWKFPRNAVVNTSNSAISNESQPVYIDGQVTLTVTEANLLDTIEATIIYEQLR